jgi:antimicrobial peptide system SdpB family protein
MLNGFFQRIGAAVRRYPAESRLIGLGRSLIALAQIVLLAITPTSYLFVPLIGRPPAPDCTSPVRSLSLFCTFSFLELQVVAWVCVGLLVLVIIGPLPRLIGILHFWVALSVATSISLPDGGEAAAQAATMALIFAAVNDRRRTHWHPPTKHLEFTTGPLQAFAWAGGWLLRVQMAYIYFNSAIAKLPVEEWQTGTAVYYVLRGEFFGAQESLLPFVVELSGIPLIAAVASWGTIVVELSIAVLLLSPGRVRYLALVLCVGLHAGIILGIGLWTFAIVMMGAVTAAVQQPTSARGAMGRIAIWLRGRFPLPEVEQPSA